MNSQQIQEKPSRNWLRVTFIASTCVFFLVAVPVLNKFVLIHGDLSESHELLKFFNVSATFAQYALIVLFLIGIASIFRRLKGWRAAILSVAYGLVILFLVVSISVLKANLIGPLIPVTGGGPTEVSETAVLITAVSGFLAAISGLYNQIISGRKAMAELELEKLKLKMEQDKAKASVGKRKPSQPKKQH